MNPTARLKLLIISGSLVAIMTAAGIPYIKHNIAESESDNCIQMLCMIDGAKQEWALENKAGSNAIPTWQDLLPYGGRCMYPFNSKYYPPRCPSGGIYTIGRVDEAPTCSFPKHDMNLLPVRIAIVDSQTYPVERRGHMDQESYEGPKGEWEERFIGSITNAKVQILDNTGAINQGFTGPNGQVVIKTWPNLPVAVIVSKKGYVTYSNSAEEVWRTYPLLLQRESK